MVRACTSMPQEHGCGVVYNRLEVSSLFVPVFSRYQHTIVVCWGGGLNKYQSTAPDCLQRPLLPRSRFRQQVSASVRLPWKGEGRHEADLKRRSWSVAPSGASSRSS